MPLLDHFHAPTCITPALGVVPRQLGWGFGRRSERSLLPEGYFAEEHVHPGARSRSTWRRLKNRARSPAGAAGPIATLPARGSGRQAPLPSSFRRRFQTFRGPGIRQ